VLLVAFMFFDLAAVFIWTLSGVNSIALVLK